MFVLLFVFSILHSSFALRASPGCNLPQPSVPQPGNFLKTHFTYNDKGLGNVERRYIIQIPTGTK